MNFKKSILLFFISVLLSTLILFFNCNLPTESKSDDKKSKSDSKKHDLPVKTILWENDGSGFIQFYTNDTNNCEKGFFTNTGQIFNPMQSIEIQVKKISGNPYMGYGIIFCAKDSDNFYRLLIVNDGYYNIYKKVGSVYSMIKDWTSSSYLNQGYNAINDIRVISDGVGNFSIYFNNNHEINFNDNSFNGGDCGYYAVVGPSNEESFPNRPVDVRFKFIANPFIIVWGGSGSGNGQFIYPRGIEVDSSGNVYVADTYNHRIQKFGSNGNYITQWGGGGSGSGIGQFDYPDDIAVDSTGDVYVADTYNHRIQKFGSNGNYITQWGGLGSENGQFYEPSGIAVDSSGNVYVADTYNYRIQKFGSNGNYITQWGSKGSGNGQFIYPKGIAVDSSGNIYVADTSNMRIQGFTQTFFSSLSFSKQSISSSKKQSGNLWQGVDNAENNIELNNQRK